LGWFGFDEERVTYKAFKEWARANLKPDSPLLAAIEEPPDDLPPEEGLPRLAVIRRLIRSELASRHR